MLVTKTINPLANAQLEWTSNEIPARGFISMDIIWNPTVVWSTREIIQITDNRNFKKDVAIILKSIDKKQNSKPMLKKSLAIKTEQRAITKKFAFKSPSPRTKSQRSRLSTLGAVNGISNKKELNTNSKAQHKKILGMNNQSNGFSNVSIYTTQQPIKYEKENMKPQSPPNISIMLDSLKFTPAGKGMHNTSNLDYLASLPTPNSNLEKNQSYSVTSSAHIYRNLNETETIMSTPLKVNDLTTVLGSYQTPIDRTEVDNSRYFENIYDRNQFAMQKTPAFNEVSSFQFHSHETSTTNEMFAIPNRKLNLDIPNVSPQNHNDHSLVVNRTQTLSSPIGIPKLSIIEEEQSRIEMSETYVKPNEHHLTYNFDEDKLQPNENLVRDVRLISTPLSKKYLSMKELTESNLSLEQKILKINQGSMPNLHKLENVKSIENNRYFYQSIEKDLEETENARNGNGEEHNENIGDTSITSVCSVQSTVSTLSVAFHEDEIKAQSSRLNLNEIGRNKITKPPTNLYFTIDKPTKSTNGMNRATASNKYLSASSPNVNKVLEKPNRSHSIRDISSSAKGRPSVIAYANGRSTLNNSTSLKKRTRDDKLDSSTKSLNKLSPPKRACIEPESPKTRGQAFRTKTWGGVMPKKFRIPSIPTQRLQLKRPEEERVILYDPELHMRSKYTAKNNNPHPYFPI